MTSCRPSGETIHYTFSIMGFSNAEEGKKVVAASTKFAFQLFRDLSASKNGGNVFLSPASVNLALAMTYLGAKNETAKQMSEVLKFGDVNPDLLHDLFSELRQSLTSDGNCTLNIANKLYPQQDYTILPEFIEAARKHYDATAENVNFAGDGEGARKTINEWVESKTNKKIKELLPDGSIDPLTRLILVNAVYFKGDWNEKFDPANTQEADFRLAEGGSVKVPLMHLQKKKFDYGISRELNDVKALRLPYAGGKLNFVVLLPEHPEGINDLEKNLTVDHIINYERSFCLMPNKEVMVYLPRFKLEDSFDLGDTLSKQGMRDLFSTGADLSGIDGTRNLFVSKVIHKSFIEVNEEGSEAAAATGVMMMVKGLPRVYNFRADHPFLFFIQDKETGAIVFMGKYSQPK